MSKTIATISSSQKKVKPVKGSLKAFVPKGMKPTDIKKRKVSVRSWIQYWAPIGSASLATFTGTQISLLERDGFNASNFGFDGGFWILSMVGMGISLMCTFALQLEDELSTWGNDYAVTKSKNGDVAFIKNSQYTSHYSNSEIKTYEKILTIKKPSFLSILDPTLLFRNKKLSHYVKYSSDTGKFVETIYYARGFSAYEVTKTYEAELSLFDSAVNKVKFIHLKNS